MRSTGWLLTAQGALLLVLGCSGGEAPPAPPVAVPPSVPAVPAVPPGMVMVTVSASSTPAGATVTGGGALLGTTPLVTSVPVPAPAAGETQTFAFTFQLPGYLPTTVTASPVNSTVNLNAVLSPIAAAVAPPTVPPAGALGAAPPGTAPGIPAGTAPPGPVPPGTHFTVNGTGGGRIYDDHTTSATATVTSICRINTLRVVVEGRHSYHSDLVVRLTAPDGESFTLQNHASRNPFRSHNVARARGHTSVGVWTLSVADTVTADSGNLDGFSLEFTCG
jgi:hypothetical protein